MKIPFVYLNVIKKNLFLKKKKRNKENDDQTDYGYKHIFINYANDLQYL